MPRCAIATIWYRRFTRPAPLETRIGQYWLQLPAAFGPRELPALWQFLDALPATFTYGVEVRHPCFFDKGEDEQRLNRGLHARGVNRVIPIVVRYMPPIPTARPSATRSENPKSRYMRS